MAQVIFAFRQTGSDRRGIPSRRIVRYLAAFERWLSDWRVQAGRARAEAELRRKLEGYNDHLLRDIGLAWDNGRVRPRQPEVTPWS